MIILTNLCRDKLKTETDTIGIKMTSNRTRCHEGMELEIPNMHFVEQGRFNSPRHPSNYPSSTNCTYLFFADYREQVQIVFDSFKVRTDNLPNNTELGKWRAYG